MTPNPRVWIVLVALWGLAGAGFQDASAASQEWVAAPPHLNFTPLELDAVGDPSPMDLGVVHAFLQDESGYLWLGSHRGLRRYDGYGLHDDGLALDPDTLRQLQEGAIVALASEPGGRLWVATADGLVVGVGGGAEAQVHTTEEATPDGGTARRPVTTLLLDSQGILWVGTEGGLDEIAPNGRRRRHRSQDLWNAVAPARDVADDAVDEGDEGSEDGASLDPEEPDADSAPGSESVDVVDSDACRLADEHITALLEDSQGALWIGTQGGLHRFDRVRSCFESFRHDDGLERSLGSDHVTVLLEDSQGTLWVGTADAGLDRMVGADGNFFHLRHDGSDPLTVPHDHITAVFEDSQHQLWVGTVAGLSQLDPSTGRFDRYIGLGARSHGLPVGAVRSLYEDGAGTLWLGTDGGVASLPALRRYFRHYLEAGFETDLDLRETLSIYEDFHRRLWVGTARQGLFIIDRQRRRTHRFRQPAADGLQSMAVPAITGDGQGTIWLGTAGAGVWWRHPESRVAEEDKLERLPHGGRFPEIDRAEVTSLDLQGEDLWIGTRHQGLFRFDASRRRLELWRHDGSEAPDALDVAAAGETVIDGVLSSDHVTAVLADSRGDVWIGTADAGFDRWRTAIEGEARFEHHGITARRLYGRHTSTVNDFYEDGWGKVWVATEGGLLWFDNPSQEIRLERRLGTRAIKALVDDMDGNLWVSDAVGLWRIPLNPDDEENGGDPLPAERFTVRHGLLGQPYAPGAVFRGPGAEELFFGGEGGINLFEPQLIVLERPAPPVVLTDVSVEGQHRDVPQDAWEVRLDSEERELTIEVAALDFVRPQDNQYAFFLEGEDRGWVETGRQRRIRYNRLKPGDYTLYVAAAHADGVWNREAIQLDVKVAPKLRQRASFQIAAASVVALGGALLVLIWERARHRRQVRLRELEIEGKQRQLGAQEDQRSSLAREIHEGPLTAIPSVMTQLESKPSLDPDEMRAGAESLREAIHQLRDISSSLHSPVLGRFGLAAAIRERLARLGRERPRLEIQLDLAADGQQLSEPVRLVLYRIFEQALSNALRHGDPSWIRIVLELSATGCRLRLIDDGRGFRVPLKWMQLLRGKYQGLLDMVERAESVGGECLIRSIPGRGTEVRVVAPFQPLRRRGKRKRY